MTAKPDTTAANVIIDAYAANEQLRAIRCYASDIENGAQVAKTLQDGGYHRVNVRVFNPILGAYLTVTLTREDEGEYPGPCQNGPSGMHNFIESEVENGGDGRSYCQYCLADGDA